MDRCDRVAVGHVDHMGGAEVACECEPPGVAVDGHDARRAREARGHDGCEPDRARAVDGDARAERGAQHLQHGARPRPDPAGEGADERQWHVVGDGNEAPRLADRVGGEGGLPEEVAVERRAARVAHRRRAVGTGPRDHEGAELGAVARLAFEARGARPAPRPADHDVVAGGDARHAGADLFDDAGALVAEDARCGERHVAVTGERVGVADARRHHAHEHLAAPRRVDVDVFDHERRVEGPEDRGARFHDALPDAPIAARMAPATFPTASSASERIPTRV